MEEKKKFFYLWKRLFKGGLSVPKRAFSNPKFVFSFLVIMLISSSGVWAPEVFDINLSPTCTKQPVSPGQCKCDITEKESNKLSSTRHSSGESPDSSSEVSDNKEKVDVSDTCRKEKISNINLFQGFPIFMFNLGLLGGIAFEFFVRQGPNKYEDMDLAQDEINDYRISEFAGFFVWVLAFILSFFGLKEPVSMSLLALFGSFLSVSLWICSNFNKAEFSHDKPNASNIEADTRESELQGSGLS